MIALPQGRHPDSIERLSERYAPIDGHNLRHGVSAGLAWLQIHQQVVNSLNVFPVPDGDTGTNMVLTMQAAWEEIENKDSASASEVAHMVAQGALMGARGNSGVILSQLWRGIARALDGHQSIDVEQLVKALREARDTAYKGVVRPVEGTILTVSEDIASAAEAAFDEGIRSPLTVLERIVGAAAESVERTPDLLPVLKEAGVVDSGGKGLYFILEGMLRAVYRMPLDEPVQSAVPLSDLQLDGAAETVEPGQDWEVVVDFRPRDEFNLSSFYDQLEGMGTSIQVGEGEGMYRMHIHVPDETQYRPIDYIMGLGTVTKVHIENLMDQMGAGQASLEEIELDPVEPGQIATVVVAPGPGLARVFASLGATAIVEGGQTMNPSTEEILDAFENLPTDQVLILPNNKNVRLASEQAAELTVKQVRVLPTVSVPQGVCAMFEYDRGGELEAVAERMTRSLESIQYAELTTATRSVEIEGVPMKTGQVIGMLNGKLIAAADNLELALSEVLQTADLDSAEIVTLYAGKDLPLSQANTLADQMRATWQSIEFEVVDGGQPHYPILLSIE